MNPATARVTNIDARLDDVIVIARTTITSDSCASRVPADRASSTTTTRGPRQVANITSVITTVVPLS